VLNFLGHLVLGFCELQCFSSLHMPIVHHTLAQYCESVVKATKQVNRKGQNSTPRNVETP